MIKIGSLFTGIGGLEQGLLKSGKYKLVYQSELDKWCNSILRLRHPNVPNLGDVKLINPEHLPDVDLITFGSPCQDFSSQGNRTGLNGKKSKLFFEAIRIIKKKQPKYVLWENVNGATTHKDFKIIKEIFQRIGYEIDFDIFNAREFTKTIQQRKRVIVLATHKEYKQVRLNRQLPSIEIDAKMQDIKERLVGVSKSHRKEHIDIRMNQGIANTLVTGHGCSGMSTKNYIKDINGLRNLSINECELLMTWNEDITKHGLFNGDVKEIPLKQRYKMCGNGVVSDLITHLLKGLLLK